MFKLQVYHQYVHPKSLLLWANLKRKISALLTETHYSGPRRTEMSVYQQIFRSLSKPPASLSWKMCRLTDGNAPLVHSASVSCSVWARSRLATAVLGATKHAAGPSVLLMRGQKAPWKHRDLEELKQLFLCIVFWQSLKNKKFFPPIHLTFSSNVNARESIIMKA